MGNMNNITKTSNRTKRSNNHTDSEPIIMVTDLYKIYKTKSVEVVALRGLSLEIFEGEFITIMGPSGCGKSTLLNIIGAIDKPSAGKVVVNGMDISLSNRNSQTHFRNKNIGIIFQFFNLVPALTAFENVALPLYLEKNETIKIDDRVNELLNMVGMRNRSNHYPDELSGGEQQLIAIASALANDPKIILADEPTGELDSENGLKILHLLSDLKNNHEKTIVVVTHDPRTLSFSDRCYRIDDGIIIGIYNKDIYDRQTVFNSNFNIDRINEMLTDKRNSLKKVCNEIERIDSEIVKEMKRS